MNDLLVGINGRLFSLDARTGQRRWTVVLGETGLVTFAVNDELVIASGQDQQLVGVERLTGTERFRVTTAGFGKATLLLDSDAVFVAKSGELECFGLDGVRRWHDGFKGMGVRSVSLALGHQVSQSDEF